MSRANPAAQKGRPFDIADLVAIEAGRLFSGGGSGRPLPALLRPARA